MYIRAARLSDAMALARVQVQSWQETYTELLPESTVKKLSVEQRCDKWQQCFMRNESVFAVEIADVVVGFIQGGPSRRQIIDYPGEIYAMYLLQAHHRKGTGTALFRKLQHELISQLLSPFTLYVLAENPAVYFYKAMGGRVIGEQLAEYDGYPVRNLLMAWK